MPEPSNGNEDDELERTRDRIVGIAGSASVKSWFPRFRQTQGQLVSNEARLQAIVRTIPFDLWAVDLDGRFVLQNEASIERVGLQIGRKADDLSVSADAIALFARNIERALGGETLSGERRVVDGSGEHWALEIMAPVKAEGPDEQGRPSIEGAIGINIDISDRKMAEERLRRANEVLEATVEERTEEIRRANVVLAERNRRLQAALKEVEDSREALLRSERLATSARMAGRVAHELNTPLGALLSSVNGLEEMLVSGLSDLVAALASLDSAERTFCLRLIATGASTARGGSHVLASRAERHAIVDSLAERGVDDPLALADSLLDIAGSGPNAAEYLDLAAEHPGVLEIANGFVQAAKSSAIARHAAEMAAAAVRSIERGVADAYSDFSDDSHPG